MLFLYNLAFLIFGFFYLPTFLLKLRQAESPLKLLQERCGIFSREFQDKLLGKRVIWIHAVSVGEVMVVQNFIQLFLKRHPEFYVVLSTVTPTGQRIAKTMEGPQISVCYFPFDLTVAVRRTFNILDPNCLLLVETEIWPNLLQAAKRNRIPVGILNARLSAKSAKRYGRILRFIKHLFASIDFALVQDSQDARRFTHLGIPPANLHVLGNMKFEIGR